MFDQAEAVNQEIEWQRAAYKHHYDRCVQGDLKVERSVMRNKVTLYLVCDECGRMYHEPKKK